MTRLYVVGIGPGGPGSITYEADAVLSSSDLICGYTEYIDLIAPRYPKADFLSTPMMREVERCRLALEAAAKGKTVAMVCSGDAGVYGMAGPILELSPDYPEVDIETVAGVTAAQSGAAVLGAPLCHDFAVISLSDLMTSWETIEQRLDAVGAADFCLCLYNPRSKKRPEHLKKAVRILLRHKQGGTVCGWVRNIDRPGQDHGLLGLAELENLEADMFTTIFIGNSETYEIGGKMVTPRGYGVNR